MIRGSGGSAGRYRADVQPVGCFFWVINVIGIWALLFGVTLDGKHYGLDCSCAHGVTVHRDSVPTQRKASP